MKAALMMFSPLASLVPLRPGSISFAGLMVRLCSAVVLLGPLPAMAAKPNVIVIMADDQGSVDLGCYGATDLHTPHTDALAGQGVRFTQFYSGAPVCSPSRACLLTGRYPVRAGVPGNCASQRGGKGALPDTEVTLAEMFKAAGYATAHIGKWHLGYTPETQPNAQGFDHSFGHMGGCIDNYSHFFYWSGPNIHDLHRNGAEVFCDGEYFPGLMVREAAGFLQENKDRPFFLYYALNTPHYPYQGDAKWLKHFEHLPYPRNLYAAFLASQDERVGALLAHVDALGLRERTIIAFQSDNGHSTEERAHFGGGSAGPYRGAKFRAAAARGPIAAQNSACSRAGSACRRFSRGREPCRRTKLARRWPTPPTGCPRWRNCAISNRPQRDSTAGAWRPCSATRARPVRTTAPRCTGR